MSISLVNVAKYYQEFAHQKQALQLLQQQIESNHPTWLADSSNFAKTWRTPVVNPSTIPQVQIISNGKQLKGEWRGKTFTINASEFNVRVVDAPDPQTGQTVPRQMSGDRISAVSVHPTTGQIAVGVLLQYFAATTISAVFTVMPQTGGYTIYRVKVPGTQPLPDNNSTYALSSIQSVHFLEENLLVKHADASDAQALVVFKPVQSPAFQYAGCVDLKITETGLCARLHNH